MVPGTLLEGRHAPAGAGPSQPAAALVLAAEAGCSMMVPRGFCIAPAAGAPAVAAGAGCLLNRGTVSFFTPTGADAAAAAAALLPLLFPLLGAAAAAAAFPAALHSASTAFFSPSKQRARPAPARTRETARRRESWHHCTRKRDEERIERVG